MRASLLQFFAHQILLKLDVTYANYNVKVEVFHPPERYERESLLVLPAEIVNNNAWKLELTWFEAEQLEPRQIFVYFNSRNQHSVEDNAPNDKEARMSKMKKKFSGKLLRRKKKSSVQMVQTDSYKLLQQNLSREKLIFSTDFIKAILDVIGDETMILTFTWKEPEPMLYIGRIPPDHSSWWKLKHYADTPCFFPMRSNILGPIISSATYYTGTDKSAIPERQNLYFNFSRVVTEVPKEVYDMMVACLPTMSVSDPSFDCDDDLPHRMPSIKFKTKTNDQEFELTGNEYIVKMPANAGEPESSRGKCYMAIVASEVPYDWVLGATFAKRYTLEIKNVHFGRNRVYAFMPH